MMVNPNQSKLLRIHTKDNTVVSVITHTLFVSSKSMGYKRVWLGGEML